ncbi:hypothetical protein RSOLAG22IIIB_10932 [Rhizoctonia solani]|uniref:Protein kinase domain-containing protein n=1 Tax=Rhizoctonia solani TaxID=456999 RepID=A0A0K6G621_9AGAM|nr:hypothetical protein RSOLAG22IIIB_10932 [Rhizoctonia solani]
MVSHASKLVVKADTSVEDLVSHSEQHGLTNYAERLHPNNIASVTSITDTALANVYRVELLHHEPVAIKCVKHQTPYKRLKRATRELSCWSSYSHDNILPLLGFAVVSEGIAMVSPWIRNGRITDYVAHKPDCNRLELSSQLVRAIAYLHAHEVVHGDVKRAPEILLGSTDSTKEADIYALAATMTKIYTGEQPYNELYWNQARQKVISGQLRPSRPIQLPIDAVGNGVWELLNYCWAMNPNERPTSSEVDEWFQYYISFEIKS